MNLLTGILFGFAVVLGVAVILTDNVQIKVLVAVLALTAVGFGTLLWVSQVRGWGRNDDY